MIYHQLECNITSFDTTDQEFMHIVENINKTLVDNALLGVDVLQESVFIGGMFNFVNYMYWYIFLVH